MYQFSRYFSTILIIDCAIKKHFLIAIYIFSQNIQSDTKVTKVSQNRNRLFII